MISNISTLLFGGPNDPQKDKWVWGLGDDGEIYFQSSDNEDPMTWYKLKTHRSFSPTSLRVMKRLIKEFGDLLVFI